MKLELLTNATGVEDAIRFVSQKSKDSTELKSAIEGVRVESNERDYDEGEDKLEVV